MVLNHPEDNNNWWLLAAGAFLVVKYHETRRILRENAIPMKPKYRPNELKMAKSTRVIQPLKVEVKKKKNDFPAGKTALQLAAEAFNDDDER